MPPWKHSLLSVNDCSAKGKNKIYLVKWQDQGYDAATWEDPREAPDGLEDFEKHVDNYWKRRTERLKSEKDKNDKKEKPKKSLVSFFFESIAFCESLFKYSSLKASVLQMCS